jgi:hypothetical protein
MPLDVQQTWLDKGLSPPHFLSSPGDVGEERRIVEEVTQDSEVAARNRRAAVRQHQAMDEPEQYPRVFQQDWIFTKNAEPLL